MGSRAEAVAHDTYKENYPMLSGKSEPKGLIVTFPDGTVFSSNRDSMNQTEVWVKTIEKLLAQFGVNHFMQADRDARLPHSKERFISTNPKFRDTKTRSKVSTQHKENGRTYFITHDYNAIDKKGKLNSISDALSAGLKVVVP